VMTIANITNPIPTRCTCSVHHTMIDQMVSHP
jgi:hypothetical protein